MTLPTPATTTVTAADPSTWVHQHGNALYAYALTRVRNPSIAEDLVQATLLAAFQSRGRFAGQSSERTWLIGILKHKVADHFRRASREQPVEDIERWPEALAQSFDAEGQWKPEHGPQEWGQDAAHAIERREFQTTLADCLHKLPQRIAAAFTLREMEELKTEDVCKALQISPTNLWVMLHRARMQLRQCLEHNWFGRQER